MEGPLSPTETSTQTTENPGVSQEPNVCLEKEAGPSRDYFVPRQPDWSLLPDVTTAMIASYLLPWQRGYMAMACTNWHRAIMESPALWRSRDFRIHGNWRDTGHLSYVKSLGRHLKRIYCAFGFRSHRYPRRTQKFFTALLAELYRNGPVQLKEFYVHSLQFYRNFQTSETSHARNGILRSLKRFLRRQTMLEKLDLSDGAMRLNEGVDILFSAAEHSSPTLQMLYIDETFQHGTVTHSSGSFVRAMSQFSKLVDVTLNYSCVSAEVLLGLASSCRDTLKVLNITTHRQDSHEHAISRESWVEFREAVQRVQVNLSMSGIVRMASVYRILSPSMPLTSLRIFGHNEGAFHPDRTLRHVSRHFQHTILKIVVDVGPVYHPYTRGLAALIRNCSNLESLQIHGRIAWPELRDVFDFVDENYIKKGLRPSLTYFRMVITTMGVGQEEALVMEEFRSNFDEHNLNYELIFDPMYPLPLGPIEPLLAGQVVEDEVMEVW